MAQASVLQCAGLYTADNPHSAVPVGALVKAENAVLRYKHRLGPRRGQPYYEAVSGTATTFGAGSARSNEGAFFGGGLVHHHGTSTLARVVSAVGNTDYAGTYTPVDAATLRMKFAEVAGNLYFNTTLGNYLLETITSTPAKAGVPRALDDFYAFAPNTHLLASATGWMEQDTAANYRFVWGIKDSNGNVKLGAPSSILTVRNRLDVAAASVVRAANVVTVTVRQSHNYIVGDVVTLLTPDGTFLAGPHAITVVPNSSTFRYAEVAANAASAITFKYSSVSNVTVPVVVPSGITTSHFVRVYRSEETESADLPPSTEVFLQSEVYPSAAEITATSVVITDRTPSSQLGPPLYTNPNSGAGDAAAKFRPPIGKDMCQWDGKLWMFNTTDRHRFTLRLLGIGTPSGLQHNDTITIGTLGCTAKSEGLGTFAGGLADPSLAEFTVYTSFPSIAQNIEYTMRSLWFVFKYNSLNSLIAYYQSGDDDPPGVLLFEEVQIGGSAFVVHASRPSAWGPALTTSSTGAQTSVADRRQNGASYSDVDEPEAFQLLNWLPVGPKGVEILRAVPFRDKLFVFSANRKVYSITGPAPYRVDELDGSALLIAPDSVKVHSNQVFALTDQGVGILSDAGFRIVSTGIEDELLDVLALSASVVRRYAFGFSYEGDRQYQIWIPTSDSDTCCRLGFVYNSLWNTWTKWTGDRTWASVSPTDGRLYMGDGATNKLRQERKTLDRTDFADESVAVTISGYSSGTSVNIGSTTGVAAGDMLTQSSLSALITAVVSGSVVTVQAAAAFTNAAAKVLKAIPVSIKYAPLAPNGPAAVKCFRDVTLHFMDFVAYAMKASFDSETYSTESTATIAAAASYGTGSFGEGAFGSVPTMRNRRVEVTPNHHSAAMLRVGITISEAWAIWNLLGFTPNLEGAGDGGRP